MPAISQKLHYMKAGVITGIELYDTQSDVGADNLGLTVSGAPAYARLGAVDDPSASDLRVHKNGTTYAVLKEAEQELPSGFIAIFEGGCPTGWTREASFDDNFLRGAAVYNATPQGAQSHDHTFSPGSVSTTAVTISEDKIDTTNDAAFNPSGHTHALSLPGTISDTESIRPPYINVVYCRKD